MRVMSVLLGHVELSVPVKCCFLQIPWIMFYITMPDNLSWNSIWANLLTVSLEKTQTYTKMHSCRKKCSNVVMVHTHNTTCHREIPQSQDSHFGFYLWGLLLGLDLGLSLNNLQEWIEISLNRLYNRVIIHQSSSQDHRSACLHSMTAMVPVRILNSHQDTGQ